jgi:hypothetical protein
MKTEFDNTENEALNKTDVSGALQDELDLVDRDIAEFYKKQNGNYFKGTPLLAQLVRELKLLNTKSNDR